MVLRRIPKGQCPGFEYPEVPGPDGSGLGAPRVDATVTRCSLSFNLKSRRQEPFLARICQCSLFPAKRRFAEFRRYGGGAYPWVPLACRLSKYYPGMAYGSIQQSTLFVTLYIILGSETSRNLFHAKMV